MEIQEKGAISGFQQSDQAMNCLTLAKRWDGICTDLIKLIIIEWVPVHSVGTQDLSVHYMDVMEL